MSQEQIEIIRRSFEAVNRSDAEAMAALCDDDVEFVSILTRVEETCYRGKDTWATHFSDMREMWEEWRWEDPEIFEADDEHLVAFFRIVVRAKRSGVRVEQPGAITYRFRDGKLWRIRGYFDPRKAREAVGLKEQEAQD